MIKQDKVKRATLLKVTLLHVCFSRFLNCINGTKSRKVSHIFALLKVSLALNYEKIDQNRPRDNACVIS